MMLAFFAYTDYRVGDENIVLDSSILASIEKPSDLNPIQVAVYPNPASDFLYVNFESIHTSAIEINILNTQGQNLYSTKEDVISDRAISSKINISSLSPGIYFFQVKDDQGNTQQKTFVVN